MALTYPENKLACEFPRWLPLAGEIEECNVLTAKHTDASISLETWKLRIPPRNEIAAKLLQTAGSELALERWNKTMAEVAKGWVSTTQPVPRWQLEISHYPRFDIWEQRGSATKKKIRLAGDFKRSEVNSLLKLHDASVPNALDTMCAMARAFALSWPNIALS